MLYKYEAMQYHSQQLIQSMTGMCKICESNTNHNSNRINNQFNNFNRK